MGRKRRVNAWKASNFLNQAGMCYIRGDYRGCADNYLRAFDRFPDSHELKYCCLSGFTSLIREQELTRTDADMRFLQRVSYDMAQPALHRAQAAFTFGFAKWLRMEMDEAAIFYRKAERFCRAATADERARMHRFANSTNSEYMKKPAGPIIDKILGYASDNIAMFAGGKGS